MSTQQLNRSVAITIGKPGSEGLLVKNLRVHFNIKKTSTPEYNTGKVEIYNLSADTRQQIELIGDEIFETGAQASDKVLIVTAGYVGSERQIFIGNITLTNTAIQRPHVVTTINASDGLTTVNALKLPTAGFSSSWQGPASAKNILKTLISKTGLSNPDFNWSQLSDRTYQKGFSFHGDAKVLFDILCNYLGLEWSVQNNCLKLLKIGQSDGVQVVSLNSTNGLIDSPEKLQDASSALFAKVRKAISKDKKAISASGLKIRKKILGGLKVKCLLRPEVNPGNTVEIESTEVPKSLFRVVEVEHEGDTYGESWTTTMVLMIPQVYDSF